MKLFLNLTVMFCIGMTLYHFISQPEETHQLIFWSMLALFNNQSLIKINQNKEDE
tara:strand:+ start:444 stop:608 length:165 start_codon:yes stop_codon:yes gene_type:complete